VLFILMRPSHRRPHYALHPIRLSVRLSVPYQPLTRKRYIVSGEFTHMRSNLQSKFEITRSKIKATGAEMWKSFSAHIFAKKCIDSRKAEIWMSHFSCCEFRPIQCNSKMRSFRDNPATLFESVTRFDTHADCHVPTRRCFTLCAVYLKQHIASVLQTGGPHIVSAIRDALSCFM